MIVLECPMECFQMLLQMGSEPEETSISNKMHINLKQDGFSWQDYRIEDIRQDKSVILKVGCGDPHGTVALYQGVPEDFSDSLI